MHKGAALHHKTDASQTSAPVWENTHTVKGLVRDSAHADKKDVFSISSSTLSDI